MDTGGCTRMSPWRPKRASIGHHQTSYEVCCLEKVANSTLSNGECSPAAILTCITWCVDIAAYWFRNSSLETSHAYPTKATKHSRYDPSHASGSGLFVAVHSTIYEKTPNLPVHDMKRMCWYEGRTCFEISTLNTFPPAQDIMRVPPVASVCPPNECETFESQQVASDCMWSDPAKDEQVKPECLNLPSISLLKSCFRLTNFTSAPLNLALWYHPRDHRWWGDRCAPVETSGVW